MRLSIVYCSVAHAMQSDRINVSHEYWIYGYMKDPFSGFKFNSW